MRGVTTPAARSWSSLNQDGSGWGMYAQRFNANGTYAGSEFRVNPTTSSDQHYSRVAIGSSGNFVITWQSNQTGSYSISALNGLSFSPNLNFTGAASVQIVTNDQGNTGSGGAQSDSDTVNITVNAVNDAPINTVPGPQSINEDAALVFSSGGGNQISVNDLDAGTNPVRITLTATNGTLSLNGAAGLSFTVLAGPRVLGERPGP